MARAMAKPPEGDSNWLYQSLVGIIEKEHVTTREDNHQQLQNLEQQLKAQSDLLDTFIARGKERSTQVPLRGSECSTQRDSQWSSQVQSDNAAASRRSTSTVRAFGAIDSDRSKSMDFAAGDRERPKTKDVVRSSLNIPETSFGMASSAIVPVASKVERVSVCPSSPTKSDASFLDEAADSGDSKRNPSRILPDTWGSTTSLEFEITGGEVPEERSSKPRSSFQKHVTTQMRGRLRAQSKVWSKETRSSWYDDHIVTKFTDSRLFASICSGVIFVNVLFVGYETDAAMKDMLGGRLDPMDSTAFRTTHLVFDVLFLVELGLRLYVSRKYFFVGPDKYYNLLDAVLVVISVVEQASTEAGLKSARVIRALRMLKVLRLARMLRFFSDLRLMVASIIQSCSALTWALLLLGSIMYLFAIVFMQGLLIKLKEGGVSAEVEVTVTYWYGSLSRSMLTLLQAITSGVDWDDVARPLEEIAWIYMAVFAFYVAFVVIGVMNVLTGIFVERAQELSGLDRDLIVQSAQKRDKAFFEQMQLMFEEADSDCSGSITWDEFKDYLQNEEIRTYLAAQQLDANDAKQLFELLDVDGNLEVMLPDFIMGLSRLRGPAKGVDLVAMLKETRDISARLDKFTSLTERRLAAIHHHSSASLAATASYASYGSLGSEACNIVRGMSIPPVICDEFEEPEPFQNSKADRTSVAAETPKRSDAQCRIQVLPVMQSVTDNHVDPVSLAAFVDVDLSELSDFSSRGDTSRDLGARQVS